MNTRGIRQLTLVSITLLLAACRGGDDEPDHPAVIVGDNVGADPAVVDDNAELVPTEPGEDGLVAETPVVGEGEPTADPEPTASGEPLDAFARALDPHQLDRAGAESQEEQVGRQLSALPAQQEASRRRRQAERGDQSADAALNNIRVRSSLGSSGGQRRGNGVGYGELRLHDRSSAQAAAAGAIASPFGVDDDSRVVVDREQYQEYGENEMFDPLQDPLATFSVDVDTASYTLARRTIGRSALPVAASVRVEEFLNFFDYRYPTPPDLDPPFAVNLEAAPSEFGEGFHLMRVGIQGYDIDPGDRAPANLVFLIDVSGSMGSADKIGLVKFALEILVGALGPEDTLAIVVYASREGVLLEPTPVANRTQIRDAIASLTTGGSTNGEGGIRRAYDVAESALLQGGTNRVIWCTDGDLNVGMRGDELLALIEENRDRGVTLTTLGFGSGNYNDRDLERFADRGNGNYAYIDGRNEALRVLAEDLMGTLEVIAADVKIQVEVDPDLVSQYRLIGYENRDIADRDFRNDAVDAGEIGSGHSVTAYLEFELRDDAVITRGDDAVATVRVRWKEPGEEVANEVARVFRRSDITTTFAQASRGFRFGAAVAELAEILRGGGFVEEPDLDRVEEVARAAAADEDWDQQEFVTLIGRVGALSRHARNRRGGG